MTIKAYTLAITTAVVALMFGSAITNAQTADALRLVEAPSLLRFLPQTVATLGPILDPGNTRCRMLEKPLPATALPQM